MRCTEHKLTIECFPSRAKTVKLFALYSPINLEEFAPLALYRELGIRDDQFATDVLTALRNGRIGKQLFIAQLTKKWKLLPIFDVDDLIKKALTLLDHIEQELVLFNLYQEGTLPFNSMWIEGEDSIVFFRVDKNDV